MATPTKIVLKITGELLSPERNSEPGGSPHYNGLMVRSLVDQIVQLQSTHFFALVVGGGNFFRGESQSVQIGISPAVGHQVGMMATVMNGLIIHDLCVQAGLKAALLTAQLLQGIGELASVQSIADACAHKDIIIFVGGTGLPFVTTDTASVMRALQVGADEVWKGTDVDGVYDADPAVVATARKLLELRFDDALAHHLRVMDATAYTIAREYNQQIRVFNIFTSNALIRAAQDKQFGTRLY